MNMSSPVDDDMIPAPAAGAADGLAAVETAVGTIAATAVANEAYFGELDAVVGDGDFGYSLARGFEVVIEQWPDLDRSSVSAFLKKVALLITGRMGGTSGPLWGTAFLRAAAAAADTEHPDRRTAVAMLRAAVDGIRARGGAEPGDKTLLDALIPATDAMDGAIGAGGSATAAVAAAAEAARTSAEATANLQARRGRASYAGERSVGSVDAGAIAVAVMFEAVATRWRETEVDQRMETQ